MAEPFDSDTVIQMVGADSSEVWERVCALQEAERHKVEAEVAEGRAVAQALMLGIALGSLLWLAVAAVVVVVVAVL